MTMASETPIDERECATDDNRDDRALVCRAASGDHEAWELIITRYGPYLGTIGQSYRLSHEEFDDAVQDTWANAVAHLSDLRDPARLRPWLATIMRRTCLRTVERRLRNREQLFGDMTGLVGREFRDEWVGIEHELLAAERASILRQALGLLPNRERQLLYHLASDELSYGEITRRLSIPVGSIGPTRMRALRRLRLVLGQTQARDLLDVA